MAPVVSTFVRRQCTFTSVVLCRCGKIFKVLTGDAIKYFPSYYFWKMKGNFVVAISEWTFADTEGLLSKGDWGQIFFLLCVHISGWAFFLLLFLSLGKYKKTNVEWVEAAVVCSRKVQWKEWQTFFSTFKSLCWETRARLIIKVILF